MYGVLTDGSPKSDFEISYVSVSVVLELSVADFCLSTAFVRKSFLRDFLEEFLKVSLRDSLKDFLKDFLSFLGGGRVHLHV